MTLNRRIVIARQQEGEDELGQPLVGWVPTFALWASIRYMSGMEGIKAGGEVSITDVSVRVRTCAGITTGMRVEHLDEVFDIAAILPDRTRQFLDLVCKKVG